MYCTRWNYAIAAVSVIWLPHDTWHGGCRKLGHVWDQTPVWKPTYPTYSSLVVKSTTSQKPFRHMTHDTWYGGWPLWHMTHDTWHSRIVNTRRNLLPLELSKLPLGFLHMSSTKPKIVSQIPWQGSLWETLESHSNGTHVSYLHHGEHGLSPPWWLTTLSHLSQLTLAGIFLGVKYNAEVFDDKLS